MYLAGAAVSRRQVGVPDGKSVRTRDLPNFDEHRQNPHVSLAEHVHLRHFELTQSLLITVRQKLYEETLRRLLHLEGHFNSWSARVIKLGAAV